MKSPTPTHKGQRVFVHRYKDGHSSRRTNYRRKLKEGKVRIVKQSKDGWLYEWMVQP